MKIKELIKFIFDNVTIYKIKNERSEDMCFEDIYRGSKENIPLDVLEMNVKVIGSSKKNTIDIQVY